MTSAVNDATVAPDLGEAMQTLCLHSLKPDSVLGAVKLQIRTLHVSELLYACYACFVRGLSNNLCAVPECRQVNG